MHTICFDFGNVVGFFDHRRALRRLLPFTDLDEVTLYNSLYDNALEDDFEAGRIDTAEYVREASAAGRLSCTPEQFLAAFVDIFTPNAELGALIPKLATRYRLVLASNTNEAHSRHYRREFADVLRPFSAVVLSHEVGVRKPRFPYYEAVVRTAGCPAGECLFVDDMPANVNAAAACGLAAVRYREFGEFRRRLAELGVMAG
jgi:putative hydrolase of the HAD superfamily